MLNEAVKQKAAASAERQRQRCSCASRTTQFPDAQIEAAELEPVLVGGGDKKPVRSIDVPPPLVTNLAFGAAGAVYTWTAYAPLRRD